MQILKRFKVEEQIELPGLAVFKYVLRFVQVSGFIDLAQRVKKENFLPYLTGQKQLRPQPGDLSFANLTRKKSRLCSSDNWQVNSKQIT